MTTYTIATCPNAFYCLINGQQSRWDAARPLIGAKGVERLMLAQMTGEPLEITVTVEPQPTIMACDEFREPSDSEFLAMLRKQKVNL